MSFEIWKSDVDSRLVNFRKEIMSSISLRDFDCDIDADFCYVLKGEDVRGRNPLNFLSEVALGFRDAYQSWTIAGRNGKAKR